MKTPQKLTAKQWKERKKYVIKTERPKFMGKKLIDAVFD